MADHDDGRTIREGPAVVIAADAPPGDTYGREQAAKILGVSPRRVSQLADEGRFVIVQAKPLRLSAQSVHELRDARRSRSADIRATVPPADASEVSGAVLSEVRRIAEMAATANRLAIESAEDALADARAERDRARAEVERLRAELEAERRRKRRLF